MIPEPETTKLESKNTGYEKEEKLSAELREKVAEVRLDNEGKPENQKVTRKEVAAEVKR